MPTLIGKEGKMSTVSVIIPCYNSGALIDGAIQSALAQTHHDLEIVVIDDGSSDNLTVNLLNNNHWERTRILRQENMGPAAARNEGIRAANGEFILPLDADDRIDPSYVEKTLAVMHSQPGVGIVYTKALLFGLQQGPWDYLTYSLQAMVINNVISNTALYRKSDWEQVGGYTESMRHGVEDYDFWIKLLSIGIEVHQIDEYLLHYCVQNSSRNVRFSSDQEVVIATYAEIFRNNKDFFAKHADIIYRHRFSLYSEIESLRKPYVKIAKILNKMPWLLALAKSIFSKMSRI